MNLKDRGVTLGDLLLILIFVVATVLIVNRVKDSDKKAYFHLVPNEIMTAKNC